MANHHNSSRGRDTAGGPTGSSRGYTQVSSRLHRAAQDVSELLNLLTAGVAADESTTAGNVSVGDDADERGDRLQGGLDHGDSR